MGYVFGPVISRRFGRSLGVDLSEGVKQCNFDCLYCELAPKAPQAQQHSTIPPEEIAEHLRQHLDGSIDVITLTANGEPTLYPHLRPLLAMIDTFKNTAQTLILTNSATLCDDAIFETLLHFDQVKLSLDSARQESFVKIDRPLAGIHIETIIDAIRRFSLRFEGKLFIEILIVEGVNESDEDIHALNEVLKTLRVDRIDLGSIDRPPAYRVRGVSFERLVEIAHQCDPSLPIHIVTRHHTSATPRSYDEALILETLEKRPLTREDIEALMDEASRERFEHLLARGVLMPREASGITFYAPATHLGRKRIK